MAHDDQQRKTLLAVLARNRGELDPARLAALLELLRQQRPARAA